MADIMIHYEKLVPFLGQCLGDSYEIALLDLRPDRQCVCAIANGHISGRSVGAPVTKYALKILEKGSWKFTDTDFSYLRSADTQKPLISSYLYIKDGVELLGILSVSIDLEKYRNLALELLSVGNIPLSALLPPSLHDGEGPELLPPQTDDAIDRVLEEHMQGIPADRMTTDEKQHLVQILFDNGIFIMKGAVPQVARRLHCSGATIYRYLSRLKNE